MRVDVVHRQQRRPTMSQTATSLINLTSITADSLISVGLIAESLT